MRCIRYDLIEKCYTLCYGRMVNNVLQEKLWLCQMWWYMPVVLALEG